MSDNSSISKQIINYIFNDGNFSDLSSKQMEVLKSNLPKMFFNLNKKNNLKGNNVIIDREGKSHKLNYNKKSQLISWNKSQKQLKYWASEFNYEIKSDKTPKENFIMLLKTVGLERFFYVSLSKVQEHDSWIIIDSKVTKIEKFDYSMFDFNFDKLESDIFSEWEKKDTFGIQYNGNKLFEIQVPACKGRLNSIVLRVNKKEIDQFIKKTKVTNETWGISVEAALCEVSNISVPKEYMKRIDKIMVKEAQKILSQLIHEKVIPKMTECLATQTKGSKKSPTDFISDHLRVSVKTNFNGGTMVCPPDFGQPGIKEGIRQYNVFFKNKLIEEEFYKNNMLAFKTQFQDNISDIMNAQLKLLFSEDIILYLRKMKNDSIVPSVLEQDIISSFVFEEAKISFSRTPEEWNDSVSISYDGTSIANMQLHSNRSPFKFRFNMPNLMKVIKSSQS